MLTVLAITFLVCLVPCFVGRFISDMENERETLGSLADRADPQAQTFSTLECQ